MDHSSKLRGFVRLARASAAGGALTVVACTSASQPRTEPLASTSSGLTITGLYPTGVSALGTPLIAGSIDTHYALTSNDPAYPGPDAYAVTAYPGWTGDTLGSTWITVAATTPTVGVFNYTFTTTFTLSGVDPTTAAITGTWAGDNSVTVDLNGTAITSRAANAYGSLTSFAIPAGSPFQLGTNTLTFVVANGGGPTGLQIATITGSVSGCSLDSQCAAGQFCNTQISTCTAQLPNGAVIPVISGHTPPLNGMCTPAVGLDVCVSGVCDTNGNVCGYAAGDGACTPATAGTVCISGTCSSNLQCEPMGGCNVDADCTGGDWCEESTHACMAKIANGGALPSDPGRTVPMLNGMCNAAAAALVCVSGVCDATDHLNECGLATGDGTCTTNAECRSGACSTNGDCMPSGGCNVDADCPVGDWCDEAANTCNAKLANGAAIPNDPSHMNPMLDGMCTPGAALLVCASGVCDATNDLNECGLANGDGICTTSAECITGTCSANGACEPAGSCNVDADCTGGDWCNEGAHTCESKLANGVQIPNDPTHATPTLNGHCNAGAALLVCTSGVCDTTTNVCGISNGDTSCTPLTGPMVCVSGACSVNGTCEPSGGCNVDLDCAPPTPVCDPTTHMCGTETDGGAGDGGLADGGVTDGGAVDGGSTDGGVVDGGVADAGHADSGIQDGGSGADASQTVDSGVDASNADGGIDAGANDGYVEGGGCGLARPTSGASPVGAGLGVALAFAALRRRRRG